MHFNPNVCSLDTSIKSLLAATAPKGFLHFSLIHCEENSSNRSILIRFKKIEKILLLLIPRRGKKILMILDIIYYWIFGYWMTECSPFKKDQIDRQIDNKCHTPYHHHWSILSVSQTENKPLARSRHPNYHFLRLQANKVNIFLKLTYNFFFYCKTKRKKSRAFSTDSVRNTELIKQLAFRRFQITAKNSLLPSQ